MSGINAPSQSIPRWFPWLRYYLIVGTLMCAVGLVFFPPALQSDFLSLLPASEALDDSAYRAYEKQGAALENHTVWLIAAADKQTVVSAAALWKQRLAKHSCIRSVAAPFTGEDISALYRWLAPYHPMLLDAEVQAAIKESPEAFLRQRLMALMSPSGAWAAMNLEHDPLFIVGEYLQKRFESTVQIDHGVPLIEKDKQWYGVVTAQVAESQLQFAPNSPVLQLRDHAQNFAKEQGVTMRVSGLPFYAAYGMQSGYREMTLIGGLSMLGIATMIGWVFRSVRPLLFAVGTIAVGALWATMAVGVLFEKVHVIAWVFGAALLGISIDYAFHRLCHEQDVLHVVRVTATGMVTSVLVFLGLTIVPITLLNQLGVFAAVGLFVSWCAAMVFAPSVPIHWLPKIERPAGGGFLMRRLMVGACVVMVGSIAFYDVHKKDDLSQFYAAPDQWLDDEAIVQSVTNEWHRGFFVVSGETFEQWQIREKNLVDALSDGSDFSGGVLALNDWVAPLASQTMSWQVYRSALIDSGLLQDWLVSLDFKSELVDGFVQSALQPIPLPALFELLDPRYRSLWLGCRDECVSVVRVAKDFEYAAEWLDVPGVRWVDVLPSVTHRLEQVRSSTLTWLGLGMVILMAGLSWRLGWRRGISIALTPCIGIAMSIVALWLFNGTFTVFHACALLLVVGIGIDYGLFAVLSRHQPRRTVLAVLLALITSLLGFGLLGLSVTPVVQAFGVIVAPGLLGCALWAGWMMSASEVSTSEARRG